MPRVYRLPIILDQKQRDRFWLNANVTPSSDDCWPWAGRRDGFGYGHFKANWRTLKAHRVAWSLVRGEIPANKTLDHVCRNPRCVNPSHLALVSNRENILRGTSPTAKNARQTHCKRGHELAGENIDIRNGKRECKPCRRLRKQPHAAPTDGGKS